MAVHDWTRVPPSTFHDFHCRWITHLSETLNAGVLPSGYYALSEQPAEEAWPDVLALSTTESLEEFPATHPGSSDALAVAERPPQVSLRVTSEAELTALRQRTLVIRHSSGDRIVALVEIVSPGNKDRRFSLDRFVDKAVAALRQGYHLLIIDLFPPGRHDLAGIHGAIWSAIDGAAAAGYRQPADRPLTLAAYEAKPAPTAYVEPLALGIPLPEMPLFVDRGWYVNVPLDGTYMQAWGGMPERWRRVIESGDERSVNQ